MRVEHPLHVDGAMRAGFVLVSLLSFHTAHACPDSTVATDDAPVVSPCITNVDWRNAQRLLEVSYAVGAEGTSRTGIGNAANAFASLELGYALLFGGDDQASYAIEASAGATAQRFAGAIAANALATQASLRLGPARMAPSVIDEGRGNIATFPLTMELAHAGEVNARPRLGARPEVARSLFARERVELTTRAVRIEGAGTKATATAPGDTKPAQPSAWAIDAVPVHVGVDVAAQDTTRFEVVAGGALMGVVERTKGATLELLGFEYRRVDVPTGPRAFETVWMLKLDVVDPKTNTNYTLGWGEMVIEDDMQDFAHHVDPENGTIAIGGVGWFSHRSWGGFGLQYRRQPYVSMIGEIGLEDRVSGEIYFPSALDLVVRGFGARTQRLVDDELADDVTAGIEIGASYAGDGWTGKVGLELGRTFYTALDATLPTEAGFVGSFGLSVQRAGRHAWRR